MWNILSLTQDVLINDIHTEDYISIKMHWLKYKQNAVTFYGKITNENAWEYEVDSNFVFMVAFTSTKRKISIYIPSDILL